MKREMKGLSSSTALSLDSAGLCPPSLPLPLPWVTEAPSGITLNKGPDLSFPICFLLRRTLPPHGVLLHLHYPHSPARTDYKLLQDQQPMLQAWSCVGGTHTPHWGEGASRGLGQQEAGRMWKGDSPGCFSGILAGGEKAQGLSGLSGDCWEPGGRWHQGGEEKAEGYFLDGDSKTLGPEGLKSMSQKGDWP